MSTNVFNLSELDDLCRQETNFKLKGVEYILVEADGESVNKWRNELMKGMKLGPTGKTVSVENVADTEALLISMCLFYADENGNLRVDNDGNPDIKFRVPRQKIVKWANKVQTKLYDTIRKMSGIDQEDRVEELIKQRDELNNRIAELKNKQSINNSSSEDGPEKN